MGIALTVLAFATCVLQSLVVADIWEVIRMYTLLDVFMLVWAVSSASILVMYIGIYEIQLYGTWRDYGYAVIFPLTKLLACSYFRLLLKHFQQNKLAIILMKLNLIGGCLAYFAMGSHIIMN